MTRDAPGLRRFMLRMEDRYQAVRNLAVRGIPALLQPKTRNLTIAITARCNLRCEGCRYERDFMLGEELPLEVMRDVLDDAAELGIPGIRLYGGEPLLHRDLPAIVEHAVSKSLDPYVTTNATLLDRHIDRLFAVGLRHITFGFYGVQDTYDHYVERPGSYERMKRGIAAVRDRYGDQINLRLNWLLMRPTANAEAIEAVLEFARAYRTPIQVDLIHYSLPYFSEGLDQRLQFGPEDRPTLEAVSKHLIEAKRREPELLDHSEIGLRSIPDWLILGKDASVPCNKHDMIWIGADGTVQLCYVTFELGNLHETRLRDILFKEAHREAARNAFKLNCPGCHCGYDERTRTHLRSRLRYRR